jgi:Ca2+-transporting ATPase
MRCNRQATDCPLLGRRTRRPSNLRCDAQAKDCMLFAATAVANGSCRAVVNSVGMATEVGAIQAQIAAAAAEEEDTPLKKKLDKFGETLAEVCGRPG